MGRRNGFYSFELQLVSREDLGALDDWGWGEAIGGSIYLGATFVKLACIKKYYNFNEMKNVTL